MRSKLLSKVVRCIALHFGYVPISDLKALERAYAEQLGTGSDSHVKGQLSEMLARLVSLQETHESKDSGTQKAVSRLDQITESLLAMMKDIWPAAHSLDDLLPISTETDDDDTEETDRLCCHGQPVGNRGPVDGGDQGGV